MTKGFRSCERGTPQSDGWGGLSRCQRKAVMARDLLVPAALGAVIGDEYVSPTGVKVYVHGFYRDAGDPTNPVELMMLEQMLPPPGPASTSRPKGAKHPEHVKILNSRPLRSADARR